MTVPGKELEDEAAGPAIRDEGVGARVLRVDGLAARPLPLPQPPNASRPRRRPREVQEAGDTDDGITGAARSGARHLVGPVILPPTTLVVAAAVLLVTPARGGVFTIRRALHAAPCTGPKEPEDLDGEKATLHQLKMESEPLRQAVDEQMSSIPDKDTSCEGRGSRRGPACR